jgi:CheY-like chemotaxis protein
MSNRSTVVLVVEDDPIIRMGALRLVVAAGFEALEASGADEAIRILEDRGDIRLVFTDVGMPGTMDGIKLSHYIRERWPPVKLIVASGKAILDESHLPLGTKLFHKPYHDSSIIEAMISMLSDANASNPNARMAGAENQFAITAKATSDEPAGLRASRSEKHCGGRRP